MTPQPNLQQPSAMLQSMGQQQPPTQDMNAAAQQVRDQFIGLETQLQQLMKQVGDLVQAYPAFGSKAQPIGDAIETIHGALNDGMLESIRSLGEQEPAAPMTGY